MSPQDPMQNEKRIAARQRLLLWAPIWVCAFFLLTAHLGVSPIYGSEARWTQITREMFLSGDFLHPTINGEPYYDKPLLTYWMIALAALFNPQHYVSELTARIPSVISALLALGALISIAKRLFGRTTAVVAAWLFLTSWSFGFWGRLAEADMANLMFSTAAIAWFLRYREKQSFPGYLVFFVICALGAHAKGMGAIAVPVLAVLADLILFRHWKLHLANWKIWCGLVIGAGVYCIPFLLSRLYPAAIPAAAQQILDFDGTVKTSGFALAFRENVIRFFAPFDHVEPWYSYFIHLPRHLVPWTPLFLLALFSAVKNWKKSSADERWLLLTIGLIFLFFTLSGSKRHYYILPILPYCFLLTARFLLRTIQEHKVVERLETVFLKCYQWLPVLMAVIGTAAFWTVILFPSLMPYPILKNFYAQTAISGLSLLAIQAVLMIGFHNVEHYAGPDSPPNRLLIPLFMTATVMIFVFLYLLPATSMFRTERAGLLTMRKVLIANEVSPANVLFYNKDFNNAVYYLNFPFKIPLARRPEDLETLRKKYPEQRFFVISQTRYFRSLPESLKERMPLLVGQLILPWEQKKPSGKRMELRVFLPEKKQPVLKEKHQ